MREPCGRSVSGMDTWHGLRREEGSSGGSGTGEAGGTGDHEQEASIEPVPRAQWSSSVGPLSPMWSLPGGPAPEAEALDSVLAGWLLF